MYPYGDYTLTLIYTPASSSETQDSVSFSVGESWQSTFSPPLYSVIETVLTSTSDPSQSSLFTKAGSNVQFTVTLKDYMGNTVPENSHIFSLIDFVLYDEILESTVPAEKMSIQHLSNNSFQLNYTKASSFSIVLSSIISQSLEASGHEQTLKSSTALVIQPGTVSARNSYIHTFPLADVPVDQLFFFPITMCDEYNNRLTDKHAKPLLYQPKFPYWAPLQPFGGKAITFVNVTTEVFVNMLDYGPTSLIPNSQTNHLLSTIPQDFYFADAGLSKDEHPNHIFPRGLHSPPSVIEFRPTCLVCLISPTNHSSQHSSIALQINGEEVPIVSSVSNPHIHFTNTLPIDFTYSYFQLPPPTVDHPSEFNTTIAKPLVSFFELTDGYANLAECTTHVLADLSIVFYPVDPTAPPSKALSDCTENAFIHHDSSLMPRTALSKSCESNQPNGDFFFPRSRVQLAINGSEFGHFCFVASYLNEKKRIYQPFSIQPTPISIPDSHFILPFSTFFTVGREILVEFDLSTVTKEPLFCQPSTDEGDTPHNLIEIDLYQDTEYFSDLVKFTSKCSISSGYFTVRTMFNKSGTVVLNARLHQRFSPRFPVNVSGPPDTPQTIVTPLFVRELNFVPSNPNPRSFKITQELKQVSKRDANDFLAKQGHQGIETIKNEANPTFYIGAFVPRDRFLNDIDCSSFDMTTLDTHLILKESQLSNTAPSANSQNRWTVVLPTIQNISYVCTKSEEIKFLLTLKNQDTDNLTGIPSDTVGQALSFPDSQKTIKRSHPLTITKTEPRMTSSVSNARSQVYPYKLIIMYNHSYTSAAFQFSTPSPGRKEFPIWTVVFGATFVLCVVVAIVVLLGTRYRKRSKQRKEENDAATLRTLQQSLFAEMEKSWTIRGSTVRYISQIARGADAEVFLADWNGIEVAVKAVEMAGRDSDTRSLQDDSTDQSQHISEDSIIDENDELNPSFTAPQPRHFPVTQNEPTEQRNGSLQNLIQASGTSPGYSTFSSRAARNTISSGHQFSRLSNTRHVKSDKAAESSGDFDKKASKLITEGRLMKSLTHPSIVTLYGTVTDLKMNREMLVMEYLQYSLADILAASQHAQSSVPSLTQQFTNPSLTLLPSMSPKNSNLPSINTSSRLSIAIQIARGLSYLHSLEPQIIHSDINPNNILVDSHLNAKLCDFGNAIVIATPPATVQDRTNTPSLYANSSSEGEHQGHQHPRSWRRHFSIARREYAVLDDDGPINVAASNTISNMLGSSFSSAQTNNQGATSNDALSINGPLLGGISSSIPPGASSFHQMASVQTTSSSQLRPLCQCPVCCLVHDIKPNKNIRSQSTQKESLLRFSNYQSPEQFFGCTQITCKTDVFSFGIVLHQLFSSRLPDRVNMSTTSSLSPRSSFSLVAPTPSEDTAQLITIDSFILSPDSNVERGNQNSFIVEHNTTHVLERGLITEKDSPFNIAYAMVDSFEKLGIKHHFYTKVNTISKNEHTVLTFFEYPSDKSFEHICADETALVQEPTIQTILYQLLTFVDSIHSRGIVHLNLTPTAIAFHFDSSQHLFVVKVGGMDFLSNLEKFRLLPTKSLGMTAFDMPPELDSSEGPFGFYTDMWAIGVLLYQIFEHKHPFPRGDEPNSSKTYFPAPHRTMSPGFRDILSRLLEPDPNARITAHDALNHPYIAQMNPRAQKGLGTITFPPNIRPLPLSQNRPLLPNQHLLQNQPLSRSSHPTPNAPTLINASPAHPRLTATQIQRPATWQTAPAPATATHHGPNQEERAEPAPAPHPPRETLKSLPEFREMRILVRNTQHRKTLFQHHHNIRLRQLNQLDEEIRLLEEQRRMCLDDVTALGAELVTQQYDEEQQEQDFFNRFGVRPSDEVPDVTENQQQLNLNRTQIQNDVTEEAITNFINDGLLDIAIPVLPESMAERRRLARHFIANQHIEVLRAEWAQNTAVRARDAQLIRGYAMEERRQQDLVRRDGRAIELELETIDRDNAARLTALNDYIQRETDNITRRREYINRSVLSLHESDERTRNHDGILRMVEEEERRRDARGIQMMMHTVRAAINRPRRRGVTQDEIARLRTEQYQQVHLERSVNNSTLLRCCICMTDYEPGETLIILPCHHRFHRECVGEWLKEQNSCPFCKEAVVQR
ncbi:putative Protein kinase domain containing protein [Blattamonas nauphoetae]|uniref:Serine/threonine protein kinase n=1 Tax=Blattamonas nauphoetae TaxID=2049346 RepID=A0ABQ9XJ90_9EUKA|nr:putative Protein kinase domain containing protein [Blattamonas nauphoetae]